MSHFPQGSRFSRPGQSLVEYGVVVSLIACACISSVMLLGQNIKNGMDDLQGRTNGTSGAAVDPSSVSVIPPGNYPALTGPSPIANPSQGQQQICTSGGWCVNVPLGMDGTTVTETTGAQGVELTNQFASILEQIAKQVDLLPNADPSLKGMIADLANAGHYVAKKENDAYTFCPPTRASCGAYSVYSDGSFASTMDVSLNTNLSDVKSATQSFTNQYNALQTYLNQNPNSLPLDIQNIIAFETSQIQQIAGVYNPDKVVSDGNGGFAWNFAYNAQLTDQSANTICGSGGNGSCFVQTP